MANRVPLIANTSANQIQELPVLDNLDLSQSGIVNAVSIGVTNVVATGNVQVGGALTVTGDLTVNGTQTILNTTTLEVEDINIGIASASSKLNNSQLDGAGITIYGSQGDKTLTWDNGNSRLAFSTDVYAPRFYGDGSNLQGVVSGVTIQEEGTPLSTQATTLNFVGDNVTASGTGATKTITIGGGLTVQEEGTPLSTQATILNFVGDAVTASGTGATKTITISGGGISTTASSPAANTTVTLDLSAAQHHDLTLSAGITTITCTGGSFGESHSLVITQPSSGTATVEFSEYFLFPSGSTPAMSAGGGSIDLISFVVKREGSTGITTQLLASAGLNYQ